MTHIPKLTEWETGKTPKYSKISFPFWDYQIVEIHGWLWDKFGPPSRNTYIVQTGTYEYQPVWGPSEDRHKNPKILFKDEKDLAFFILTWT